MGLIFLVTKNVWKNEVWQGNSCTRDRSPEFPERQWLESTEQYVGKYQMWKMYNAALRPDMFEKLKLTISSAIFFCQVMWNLMLKLANRKRHKGPCTASFLLLQHCVENEVFPFSSQGNFLPHGPTCCSAPSPWSPLENLVTQDWDKWSRKEDNFGERA